MHGRHLYNSLKGKAARTLVRPKVYHAASCRRFIRRWYSDCGTFSLQLLLAPETAGGASWKSRRRLYSQHRHRKSSSGRESQSPVQGSSSPHLHTRFCCHFGAWGALECEGKSEAELRAYVDSLKVSTEYATCWIRFGRVFFGLGALVLAIGLMFVSLFPLWLIIVLAVLGIAPIAVTMGFPDNLEYHRPVFHLQII